MEDENLSVHVEESTDEQKLADAQFKSGVELSRLLLKQFNPTWDSSQIDIKIQSMFGISATDMANTLRRAEAFEEELKQELVRERQSINDAKEVS